MPLSAANYPITLSGIGLALTQRKPPVWWRVIDKQLVHVLQYTARTGHVTVTQFC